MSDPVLMVALPLLAAFLLPVAAQGSALLARVIGPAVLVCNLVLGLMQWSHVAEAGPYAVAIGGYAAPLGIVFYVDRLAVLFALAVSASALLLWPRAAPDGLRAATLTLLLAGGGVGLALSGDLFNLYVFYEVVAVASFGLAASRGTAPAFGASLRFLILSALGSSFTLLGIALVYSATGTLNLANLAQLAPTTLNGALGLSAFVLLVIGFGVKAELFPVNTWVPEVYAAAPGRVAGLLAGTVSKLALLVVMRLVLLVFAQTAAPVLLLLLGLLGLASGELAALRATELRRVLGYSSIGQLGLIAIAFSVPGAPGVLAGIAVALHHLLVKPAMFLLAERWGGALIRLTGAAAASRVGAGLFVLLALSLVGVPPLPGFWAKYLLLQALFGPGDSLHLAAAGVVLAATVVEAAYLFAIVRRLYQHERLQVEAPATADLFPAVVLGAGLLAATVAVVPLGAGLEQMARQTADVTHYVQRVDPHLPSLEVRP